MTRTHPHCEWWDTPAVYVLGALPDDEREQFEVHYENCEHCRAQLAELGPAVDALATGVPRVDPPVHLRDRIMARVHEEAELLRAAGPAADRPPPARRSRERAWRGWWFAPGWAVAAAALLIVVGGVGGYVVRGEDQSAPRVIQAQVSRALAPQGHAELVVDDGVATLRLRGMPQPGSGRVYQVWYRLAGEIEPKPTDALFSVRADGTATVAVPAHPEEAREVLVTAEPTGGSRRPTSRPILAARLS
jgi:anti-sigma-K factor RskA